MYPRRLTAEIHESLQDTPVVFVQGPRQSGKSTLVQNLIAEDYPAEYLSLDTSAALAAAGADPEGFLGGFDGPVAIDEVQRVPALAVAIKGAVDQQRAPGRFLLTGSANVMVLPKLSESLAGRMELHTLWPLSQVEIEGQTKGRSFVDRLFGERFIAKGIPPISFDELAKRVIAGGFPEVLGRRRPERRAAWFDAYVTAILQRDVREIANIEHSTEMPRLLALLASRATSLVNYATLARSLSLPQSTLKRYVALLEATFLVRMLPAWSANLGKRVVKSPKLMLTDTGVLSHLAGIDKDGLRRDRSLAGRVVENFVMMELTKQLGWSRERCELFHFRTENGLEVDFVLGDRKGRLVGIEVKTKTSVEERDLRGLKAFAELTGEHFHRGVLLYVGDAAVPFGKNLTTLPMTALWSSPTRAARASTISG